MSIHSKIPAFALCFLAAACGGSASDPSASNPPATSPPVTSSSMTVSGLRDVTISVSDATLQRNSAGQIVASLGFQVDDGSVHSNESSVALSSSDQSVVPDSSLSAIGTFGKYTFGLLIAPTTPPTHLSITVTATSFRDGSKASKSFTVTITP